LETSNAETSMNGTMNRVVGRAAGIPPPGGQMRNHWFISYLSTRSGNLRRPMAIP
jgi:hypothetical protein